MKPDNVFIKNLRNGESFATYPIIETSGVLLQNFDPGAVPASFTAAKGVGQDGQTLQNVNIDPRFVVVEAAIIGSQYNTIDEIKKQIDHIINPKDEILIRTLKNGEYREINGYPDGTVQYSTDYQTSNDHLLSFKIEFQCFDPYFRDKNGDNIKIETWIPQFKLFTFRAGGIKMGVQGPKQIEINNEGDIDTPIEFLFYGPALNPKIILNGDKFIKINKQIVTGDLLYIYSDYENIKVEIQNGGVVTESGYGYIDIDSDFFLLEQGKNIISYSTEGDNIPQTVFIKYKNRYFVI